MSFGPTEALILVLIGIGLPIAVVVGLIVYARRSR